MEAITFELGREGLINFKKQGKKKLKKRYSKKQEVS